MKLKKKTILKKFSTWMQCEILNGNMTIHEAEAMQQDFNGMSAKRLSNLLINFNL
jgi:hypothetical protein